jgi:hypothetical protein
MDGAGGMAHGCKVAGILGTWLLLGVGTVAHSCGGWWSYQRCSAPKPAATVRRIIIIANETSSYDVIWKQISLQPGQVIDDRALQQAEKKLEALKLFVLDPKAGIRPTVSVVDLECHREKDILVKVQEQAALQFFPKGQQHDCGTVYRGSSEETYSFLSSTQRMHRSVSPVSVAVAALSTERP